MRGEFWFHMPDGILKVPNNITDEGEQAFIKMMVRADVSLVASGGNFYVGLCGTFTQASIEAMTLSTITGEPSSAGGYARKAILRNSSGWPTVEQVNGVYRAVSAEVSFAASGAAFSTSIRRAFLCSVLSGSSGTLLAVSGPLPTALLVADGETYPMQYALYMN